MWMPRARLLIGLTLVFAGWLVSSGESAAQGVETVGVRALGMGGAFVAVADDATATYWNPAGLATGAIFSGVFEHTRQTIGDQDVPALASARDGASTFFAIAAPPVGISYSHTRTTRVRGPEAQVTTLVTDQAGVTFVESIGQYLDVAGTVKYVHGSAGIAPRDASFVGSSALDRAADLPTQGSSAIDVDLGAKVRVGSFSAGLVARNLTKPSFDAPSSGTGGAGSISLDRQVRAGVAWQFPQSTTLACDVDLTRTETELGVRRHVAIGGEHQLHPRFVVRAGVRVNTVGDARPAGSAGASVALRSSLWLDGQFTRGGDAADRGWGLSARIGF